MKITPLDIQKKQFSVRLKGFDKGEVDSFLKLIREQLEELIRENALLREESSRIEKELTDYREIESELKNTLIGTHKMLKKYKNGAQKEIEIYKKEAELKAYTTVEKAEKEATKIYGDITDLKRLRRHFRTDLRQIIESHLKMLNVHEDIEPVANLKIESNSEEKRKMLTP
ncbi:MAG: DivIVA domain-containing protein [Nitrospiraceae bacterium]|nr:MAG: DivIVA domain-containing protein [Nitrospiraceae bacterium]